MMGFFDQASIDVGPSPDWEVFFSDVDKGICSQYDVCVILFHECILSLIGFRLPFNEFEVSVINHLLNSPS